MAPRTVTVDESKEGWRGNPEAFLCVVLEAARPLVPATRHALSGVQAVLFGRADGNRGVEQVQWEGDPALSLRVPDASMSTAHARLKKLLVGWVLEDCDSKNGTILNGKRIAHATLNDGDVFELGHTFFLFRRTQGAQAPAGDGEQRSSPMPTLVPALELQTRALERAARTTVPIVLQGESGTGKEIVARAVHAMSGRPGPFVAVNCAALPAALVASELFGYRKGAFTGAMEDRTGLIRASDRGTLFLDEIGDLAPENQAAFLRVLQESEVSPLGAVKPIAVDLRVVAATHHDLSAMAGKGEFRSDLLARLSGFIMKLPQLRERREDLGLLIPELLRRHLGERATRVSFGLQAARTLMLHPWPLNVRQLEMTLEVAAALAEQGQIDLEHLPADLRAPAQQPAESVKPEPLLSAATQRRRDQLIALLRSNRGNITAVAREMGKARAQVQRWIKRLGIHAETYRS